MTMTMETPELTDRDTQGEDDLVMLAGESVELAESAAELNAYAHERANPGGVRVGPDWDDEVAQELGDARNYLVWGIQEVLPALADGEDQQASRDYERRMRALVMVVRAWHELTTEAQ